MLVVSRRPNDRIVFPKLGITVHVVRVDGKSVRLGIDAPKDVRVLRHEIADRVHDSPEEAEGASESKRRHEIRNRLNTAMLGLHLVKHKLELGQTSPEELEEVIDRVIRELSALEMDKETSAAVASPSQPQRRTALVVEDNANECELLAG